MADPEDHHRRIGHADVSTQRRFTANRIIIGENDGTEIPTRRERLSAVCSPLAGRRYDPGEDAEDRAHDKGKSGQITAALKRLSISSIIGRFREKDRPRRPAEDAS